MINLTLYKEGKNSYENELASIPINIIGYGKGDFYKVLVSEINNFNENRDILGIFRFLDGKLSKKSTGLLIYYLSIYPKCNFKVTGW